MEVFHLLECRVRISALLSGLVERQLLVLPLLDSLLVIGHTRFKGLSLSGCASLPEHRRIGPPSFGKLAESVNIHGGWPCLCSGGAVTCLYGAAESGGFIGHSHFVSDVAFGLR